MQKNAKSAVRRNVAVLRDVKIAVGYALSIRVKRVLAVVIEFILLRQKTLCPFKIGNEWEKS